MTAEAATSLDVATLVVGLDGSPFGERALAPARRLASAGGATVRLVQVVGPSDDARAAEQYLAAVAAGNGTTPPAEWSVLHADDAADGLAAAFGYGDRVLGCLATHGRDRSVALLGSVTAAVLAQVHEPLVLVGPAVDLDAGGHGPVVAAVPPDGADDGDLLRAANEWAASLERSVQVATIGDAVDVRRGLRSLLAGLDPALVVIGSRRRHGLRRLVAGDRTAELVHDAPSPTLVVPLGLRD